MGTLITIAGILLPALLALTAWRMAYLGVRVTLHPVKKSADKQRLKREFYLLAGIIVALTLGQGFLNYFDRRAEHQELTDFKERPFRVEGVGFLQLVGLNQINEEQNLPLVRAGAPVRLNSTFVNGGGAQITGADFLTKIWTIRTKSQTDAEVISQFKKVVLPEKAKRTAGQIVSTGTKNISYRSNRAVING